MFRPTKCNNVGCAIVFWVHICALTAWVIYFAAAGRYTLGPQDSVRSAETVPLATQGEAHVTKTEAAWVAVRLVCVSSGLAILWSAIWLLLLLRWPVALVRFALVFIPLLLLGIGCTSILLGYPVFAVFIFVLAGLWLLCVWLTWGRTEFTGSLIQGTLSVYSGYKSVFLVLVVFVFFQGAFLLLWLAAAVPVAFAPQREADGLVPAVLPPGIGARVVFVLSLLFSMYWGTQVFQNMVYVFGSGVAARCYFFKETPRGSIDNWDVGQAARHAFGHYFGSICLGSLLIPIAGTLHALLSATIQRSGGKEGAPGRLFGQCFASVEQFATHFGHLALTVISIYSFALQPAGQEVARLMRSTSGLQDMVRNNMAGWAMFCGSLCAGLSNALCVALASWRLELGGDPMVLASLVAFAVGFLAAQLVGSLVESGILGLLVCYSYSPPTLAKLSPELEERLRAAAPLRGSAA